MEGSKSLCPRCGEVFILWLSVLSVFVGCILASTADQHSPDDSSFIAGSVIGSLGSFIAFGFVIYVSFSSKYHYLETVITKPIRAVCEGNNEKSVDKIKQEQALLNEKIKSKSKEIHDILDMATQMLADVSLAAEHIIHRKISR